MYSILREDCSVEIDQMQATNPQWVVERRGRTQFKQVGKVGTVGGGGQRFRRREKRGWGQDTRYQATERSESPHQSLSKKDTMHEKKQGNTRRKRGVPLPV